MELLLPSYGLLLFSVLLVVWLATFIVALLSAVRSSFSDSTVKLMWVLIIIFVPVIGPLFYLVIGKRQRFAQKNG